MFDQDPHEVTIWRDYEQGKVGVQMGQDEPRFLEPEVARDTADLLEQELADGEFSQIPEVDLGDTRDMIDDLREFADDVEGST